MKLFRSPEERAERRRREQTTRENNNVPVYEQALAALGPLAPRMARFLPYLAARHVSQRTWAAIVRDAEKMAREQ